MMSSLINLNEAWNDGLVIPITGMKVCSIGQNVKLEQKKATKLLETSNSIKESQYNNSMKTFKTLEIKHEDIFRCIVDMFHDFCFVGDEPVKDHMWMFEPLKDPNEFIDAVTTGSMAMTYMIGLSDELEEMDRNNEDGVVIVTKNNKPWTSVIVSKLVW